MNKYFSIFLMMVGVAMLLIGFVQTPYFVFELKGKLNLEFLSQNGELNKEMVFGNERLTPVGELNLGEGEGAEVLKRIANCHDTISEERCVRILEGVINVVPAQVLEVVESVGFDVVLTGNDIREMVRLETGWDAGWGYDGVTFPNYEGYTRIWSSSRGGAGVLIHEIGHAYDFALAKISRTDEFKQIYEREAKRLFPFGWLYSSNEDEYFAESFKIYLKHPRWLKIFAPKTFSYFEQNLYDE